LARGEITRKDNPWARKTSMSLSRAINAFTSKSSGDFGQNFSDSVYQNLLFFKDVRIICVDLTILI
jgi:hypothetical protein